MAKNPIDPSTGRPRKGRPPKVKPIDTLAGPQPTEEAVGEPRAALEVTPSDPRERVTTELAREWKSRHRSRQMLEVPDEYKKAYPDGDFCFARNTPEGISEYKAAYDYEVAALPGGTPLTGQADSTFKFHDVILMVRPKWMRQASNELLREKTLAQFGRAREAVSQAEREASREAGGTVRFMASEEQADDPDDPTFLTEPRSRLDGETSRRGGVRLSTGTRYTPGGIPT